MGSFLVDNIRSIIHLRKRHHQDNMLGLCLGAGVSADFSFPSWHELIQKIAEHPDIKGEGLLSMSESLTSKSQFLFHMYKQNLARTGHTTGDEIVDSRQAALGWMQIVHTNLYSNAVVSEAELELHPYLWDLIPLIKQASMTVNYNFDDTIERMLYIYNNKTGESTDDKGFEVVWQPSTQFRRQRGVIYHPNGFLPHHTSDGFSEQIVFMEQEFADQLIDVGAGHYSCLLNHISKNTILFLGLSLGDTTLKHLLRVSARNNPGHFHYHIHWCEKDKPPKEEQVAIRQANFSVYNLVTLFLSTDEIKELAQLIVTDQESFACACDEETGGVRTEYRYYLTGPVGAGKTTVIEHVRCLDSFDEWVDRKHPLLAKPHEELEPTERQEVDTWINQQFRKKNRRISQASKSLMLIDRCPLDPLYFTKDDATSQRASELLEWMVPKKGAIQKIAPGHLIILDCDVSMLKSRLASRNKRYTDEQVASNRNKVFSFWNNYPGAIIIDTSHMTVAQVVKSILQIILFEKYREIKFHNVCKDKAS